RSGPRNGGSRVRSATDSAPGRRRRPPRVRNCRATADRPAALERAAMKIDGGYYLDAPLLTDADAVVEHLQERQIYENTLRIPYPYQRDHAETWLSHLDPNLSFAIREPGGRMIGATGFHDLVPAHRSEFGYWLARPFWGRGIMTRVVALM